MRCVFRQPQLSPQRVCLHEDVVQNPGKCILSLNLPDGIICCFFLRRSKICPKSNTRPQLRNIAKNLICTGTPSSPLCTVNVNPHFISKLVRNLIIPTGSELSSQVSNKDQTRRAYLAPFFLANYTDFMYASAFSLKPPEPSVAPFDISQPCAPPFFNELPLSVHTCYEPTSSLESDPTAAKCFLRPSSLFFSFSFCYPFAACCIFVCRGLLRGFSVVFYAFCCYFVKCFLGAAVEKSAP